MSTPVAAQDARSDRAHRLVADIALSVDLPAVLAVGREAWRATFGPLVGTAYAEAGLKRAWAPDLLAAEIAAGAVLVARNGTDVIGMASARPDGEETFLARLYVRPSQQHRGAGRLLLGTVLRAAPGPVTLTVLATNDRARSFYERHGFHGHGVEPDPDGGPDHLRMIRPASPKPGSRSPGLSACW
jgi:ribosomal protein S18 acetylase RimI-like enzyme